MISETLQMEFSSDFMEEAVFLLIHEMDRKNINAEFLGEFYSKRDDLYQNTSDGIAALFEKFYQEYFQRLGLEDYFLGLAGEFPVFLKPGVRMFIRRAFGRKSEGAELYVRDSKRTVVTSFQIGRILDFVFLSGYLRHEWLRISDMMDASFQYDPHASLKADNEIEENLNRDRFRILWDLSIVARLSLRRYSSYLNHENLKKQFDRVFSTWYPEDQNLIFKTVMSQWPITQEVLIDFSAPGRRKRVSGLAPVRCPLCQFTGYELYQDWSEEMSALRSLIQDSYPNWNPNDGVCPQCFELFRSRQKVGQFL